MRWSSVKAVLLQEAYVTRASWEVIFDIFIFSLANIVLFGLIAQYLAGSSNNPQVEGLLIAVIFWEVIRIIQYSTSVSSMWNVWSHNLSNMFIAPLKITEYLAAHVISALIKSVFVLSISIVIARYMFHVNVLTLGAGPILLTYVNMVLFAIAIGLVLLGFVFQFGTKVQALTWGTIFMIQPFCAVYFSVATLPPVMQGITYLFPASYFFEWLRALHTGADYAATNIFLACVLNLVYLLVGAYIFSRQLAAAKRSGQLARNDL